MARQDINFKTDSSVLCLDCLERNREFSFVQDLSSDPCEECGSITGVEDAHTEIHALDKMAKDLREQIEELQNRLSNTHETLRKYKTAVQWWD